MITRLISPANPLLAPRAPCLRLPPGLRISLFSTTCSRFDNSTINHYEVLKLKPDSTHAEIKKYALYLQLTVYDSQLTCSPRQFYSLSRTTHPDMNPHDPKASERFAQVSESYSILADPEKRKRYDRDYYRAQQATPGRSATRAAGHTGSYAGSRPPSGLSKRRGAFRGPPPSFYAHGGSSPKNTSSASSSASSGPAPGGTFDPDQYSSNPDPNFDPSSTFKTQTQEDLRRQSRRAAALAAAAAQLEDDSNFWARFFVVAGVILGAVTVGTIVSGIGGPKGGMTRRDGSRRDGPSNAWTKG